MAKKSVQDFHAILIGLLTQYDQKESLREMKRRQSPNIYRLGHLLKAADKAETAAKQASPAFDWRELWESDTPDALYHYRKILQSAFIFERGQWALPPLRQLDKKINAQSKK
jgi:hypothetical protein